MPVDPHHAFAGGPALPRPSRSAPERWLGYLSHLLVACDRRYRIARSWRTFEKAAILGAGCRLGPSAWCVNAGPPDRVRLGTGTVCRGVLRREEFGDGELVIGANVYIGDDCIISCCDRVEIGDFTLLGHGVQIFDNNSHPVDPDARTADWDAVVHGGARREIDHAPIRVGRRAWLGFGSMVLKGVTVGEGAVVASGSVVTKDVDPYTVVAGNPAEGIRVLR